MTCGTACDCSAAPFSAELLTSMFFSLFFMIDLVALFGRYSFAVGTDQPATHNGARADLGHGRQMRSEQRLTDAPRAEIDFAASGLPSHDRRLADAEKGSDLLHTSPTR